MNGQTFHLGRRGINASDLQLIRSAAAHVRRSNSEEREAAPSMFSIVLLAIKRARRDKSFGGRSAGVGALMNPCILPTGNWIQNGTSCWKPSLV